MGSAETPNSAVSHTTSRLPLPGRNSDDRRFKSTNRLFTLVR